MVGALETAGVTEVSASCCAVPLLGLMAALVTGTALSLSADEPVKKERCTERVEVLAAEIRNVKKTRESIMTRLGGSWDIRENSLKLYFRHLHKQRRISLPAFPLESTVADGSALALATALVGLRAMT